MLDNWLYHWEIESAFAVQDVVRRTREAAINSSTSLMIEDIQHWYIDIHDENILDRSRACGYITEKVDLVEYCRVWQIVLFDLAPLPYERRKLYQCQNTT